ncbi:MAG TPA: hypothetical protein PKY31_11560 [Spirochaetota bacterium]|nr:hypothetical protein [Spirochaetota bacterium]
MSSGATAGGAAIFSIPLRGFIDAIYGDLVHFHGSDEFEDDLCIVCLEQE